MDHTRNTLRDGAIALAVGTVAMMVTMGLHPSGPETIAAASHGGTALARGVHGLALASVPFTAVGLGTFGWQLRSEFFWCALGASCLVLALIVVTLAGLMSGSVATAVIERMVAADATVAVAVAGAGAGAAWRPLLTLTGLLNQAFANWYVILSAAGTMAWAVASWRGRAALPSGVGVVAAVGLLVGLALLVLRLSGVGHLDVRGFGLVVLGQALWQLLAAQWLWRASRHPSAEGGG